MECRSEWQMLIGTIDVYGLNHQLHRAFVANIKSVLDTLTALAEELRNAFPLQTNRGMSRLSAHLHLQHLQVRLESPSSHSSSLTRDCRW